MKPRSAYLSQTPAYGRHVRRMQAYGRWEPYIDATEAREHCRALLAAGMGPKRIAEVSGVAHGTISKLLYGDYGRQMPPSRRVRRATAERLLAVRPDLDTLADGAKVPALGTQRRIRALAAIGWPITQTARRIGMHRSNVAKLLRSEHTTAATARRVREVYDALCMTPGPSERSRREAREKGWRPPLWWDNIDDPRDRVGGRKPQGVAS